MKKGFTLMELLVVVLIIGILAAVALPQYQKAVEKNKAAQALTLLKATYQAYQAYYLTHGEYPQQLADLDITIPWTGTTPWWKSGERVGSVLSNQDWSLQIVDTDNVKALYVGRISGPYQGGGFSVTEHTNASQKVPVQQIVCMERIKNGTVFTKNPGDYCEKLFRATRNGGDDVYIRSYILP